MIDDRDLRAIKVHATQWIEEYANALSYGVGALAQSGASFSESEARALFYTQAQINAWRTVHIENPDIHHARAHDIVSGSDHETTATAGQIVGATSDNVLGLFNSGSDASAGNIILRSDGSGNVEVNQLAADYLTADGVLEITPTTDILLSPGGYIYFDAVIASVQTTEGDPRIYLNPETGLGDFLSIQADEAYFNAVIAQARWAEAGAIEITRSVAPLNRPFVIPGVGLTSTMYVGYLEGLPGYNPLGDGHIVKIPFFQDGGFTQQPCAYAGGRANVETGVIAGGAGYVHYDVDFSEFDPGGLGVNLLHTGANNSLTGVTNTVGIYDDSGNDVLRIETDLTNCHTHYDGSGYETLADYEYTGRFKILSAGVGFGFTLYSDYPNSDSYYRVRRYGAHPEFQMVNHGSGWSISGTTVSTYDPSDNLNVWHKFKIQVYDNAGETVVKARFWLDGDTEPGTWDIDATDANAFRTEGTFGLWYMDGGPDEIYFDDLKVVSLGSVTYEDTQVLVGPPTGIEDGDIMFCTVTYPTARTVTVPTGWTLRRTMSTSNGQTTKLYTSVYDSAGSTGYRWFLNGSKEMMIALSAIRYMRTSGTTFLTSGVANNSGAPATSAVNATENGIHLVMIARHDGVTNDAVPATSGYIKAIDESGSAYTVQHFFKVMTADAASYAPTISTPSAGTYFAVGAAAINAADGASTPFYVGSAWGTVVLSDPQPVDVTPEEAAYEFTTLGSYKTDDGSSVNAVGKTAQIDARVMDYGDPSGDVYMILTVLDRKGPPYIRLARHHGFDPVTGFLDSEVIGQFGQLAGLALTELDPQDEPGLVIFRDNGRKALLTPNQFVMEGADSYWYDVDGDVIVSILEDDGIAVHTKVEEYDAGITSGKRNYVFKDGNGDIIGGLYYSAFVPSNPILPEGQRLALRVKGDGRDGVDLDIVASQTNGARAGRVTMRAYSGSNQSYLQVGHDGTDAFAEFGGDFFFVDGMLGVNEPAPAYNLDVDGITRSRSGYFSAGTGTISSGSVFSVATDLTYGAVVILSPSIGSGVPFGMTWHNDWTTGAGVIAATSGVLATSTAVLTGATDNLITVSLVSGTLYIRNGLGYNANYVVTIFGR